MSTITASLSTRQGAVRAQGVSQRRVFRSEWTKLWSLRSNRILIALSALLLGGLGILIAAINASQWDSMSAANRASFDIVETASSGGFLAQFVLGIVGVLAMSGEYATGMIRATFSAVPSRLPVLWAKLGIVAAVSFVVSVITFGIALVGTRIALQDTTATFSFTDGTILRALFAGSAFLALVAVIGVASGAILRSTAGGIAVLVGIFFVLPLVVLAFPAAVMDRIGGYLPANAGQSLYTTVHDPALLSPLAAFLVLSVYAAAAVALAALAVTRRDA
jgi:ABC-2 type transport system permease protein